MKKFFLLILLVLIREIYSQAPEYQWNIRDTGYSFDLLRITFSDSLNGWALGTHSIIHTNDGGKFWTEQSLPNDSIKLREFCFPNNDIGYIIGEKGIILATKDGGQTWIKQHSGTLHHLMGISFIDANRGWITGEIDNGLERGGILLSTENGGIKWDTLNIIQGILYYDVKFMNEEKGIVIGSDGFDNFSPIIVYQTSNGGINLDKLSEFSGAHTRYLSLNNIDTIWAGLFGFSKSFDGGLNWNTEFKLDSVISEYGPPMFINMDQVDGRTGWSIIYFLFKGSGLYYTENYGYNWRLVNLPDGFHPTSVFYKDNNLVLGGAFGMVCTNKPLPVNVKDPENVFSFNLNQNYPNPFNSGTMISYELYDHANIKLCILDLLGREVKTLVDKPQEKGIFKVYWDGKNQNDEKMNSGIYFLRLKYQNKSMIKKVVLIR